MKRLLTLALWAASASTSQAVTLTPVSGGPIASVHHTTVYAFAAAGSFSGNDTGNASTVQNTLDTISANFGSYVPGGTSAWGLWDKTGSATGSQVRTYTSNPQTHAGTLSFDSPITGWFVVTLKASNQYSMHLFDGGVVGIGAISYSTLGTAVNHNGHAQALSHASLWGGTAPVPLPVPEPATYALFFAGLAVVGFVARRRPLR